MRRAGVVVAITVMGLAATQGRAQELVVNGGFETGEFFPWNAPPSIPNRQFFVVNSGGAHSGNHYASMSSSSFLYISQVLPTTAGTDYELSFWLRRPINAPAAFNVRWEGLFVFQEGILLPDSTNWWRFTIPLHSNITGSFLELGQGNFPGAFHIDDISVVQVPAPGAAAVLGMAAGAVVMPRRRRRGGAG